MMHFACIKKKQRIVLHIRLLRLQTWSDDLFATDQFSRFFFPIVDQPDFSPSWNNAQIKVNDKFLICTQNRVKTENRGIEFRNRWIILKIASVRWRLLISLTFLSLQTTLRLNFLKIKLGEDHYINFFTKNVFPFPWVDKQKYLKWTEYIPKFMFACNEADYFK